MEANETMYEHMHDDYSQPSDELRAARKRLAAAKDSFSKVAVLVLKGRDDAPRLAKEAIAEIDAARADMHRLQSALPPKGIWAEAAKLMGGARE